jgi:Tfp pilus assembly protein FimV
MSTYVITDLRPSARSATRSRPRPAQTSSRASAQTRGVHQVRAASTRAPLRLTRRGRAVVFVLALLGVLAFSLLFVGGSVATSDQGRPTPTRVIVVGDGETLWGIASDIAAQTGVEDVREVMADIKRLNPTSESMLSTGQELRVPLSE